MAGRWPPAWMAGLCSSARHPTAWMAGLWSSARHPFTRITAGLSIAWTGRGRSWSVTTQILGGSVSHERPETGPRVGRTDAAGDRRLFDASHADRCGDDDHGNCSFGRGDGGCRLGEDRQAKSILGIPGAVSGLRRQRALAAELGMVASELLLQQLVEAVAAFDAHS